MFERKLDSILIQSLKKQALFNDKLLHDIQKGIVFPAIRKNEVHFYYRGGRLFKYTKRGFESNIKYISVADTDLSGDVSENDLSKIQLIKNFDSGYDRIKENCNRYNIYSEAQNVSELYKYSYSSEKNSNDTILLDIEVSLESQEDDYSQDRIDILLYNRKYKTLRFYEAKLFTNKQIRSKGMPEVVDQILRYNDNQLHKNQYAILEQYKNYVNIINDLFEIDLEIPETLDDKVSLFVFDYDNNQENSSTLRHLKEECYKNELSWYFKGNTSSINIENMWTALCK